ncbi:MAG TPA: M20/M25/M40 family metallo-hydrolase [Thermoanaerobaculia bacterium]|nr:M20/M25/M40 family metallo-hydrolase [Thermoanaerobaculia bacterium]
MTGRTLRRSLILAALAVVTLAAAPPAERPAEGLAAEALSPRSRLEENLRTLTDDIGGRVTGSVACERAVAWGVEAFRKAGVDSVGLEGYPAPAKWEGESAAASLVAPERFPVRVVSFALAPSTAGAIEAPLADGGDGRRADFDRLGAAARGAVVLVRSNPMRSFDDLFAEYMAAPETMQSAVDAGAAAVLFTSTRPRDLLYRHTVTWGPIAPIPMAQVAREDGLRLSRLLARGGPARISLELRNRVGGPFEAKNVVAEIRGASLPDEIVLLGAHLDSWDLGTGALDNGVNCALVLEVARVLAAGPRPKRTVRFVFFTGEETGLLGSRGYVARHRGELDRHVAVLIHDIGDGRVRGYFDNGRPELAPALAAALAPVASWGAAGSNDEALLGTDNFDFLLEGVPNFVADQETERYLADYHAESDTFDKVDLREARFNAAVAAVAVSGLADAPGRPGPRQSRDEVGRLLAASGLEKQMKTYGLWSDWEAGRRGRAAAAAP